MLTPPRTFSLLLRETPTSAPAPKVESRMPTPTRPASPRLACRGVCGSEESTAAPLPSLLCVLSSDAANDAAGRTIKRPQTNNAFLHLSVFRNANLLLGVLNSKPMLAPLHAAFLATVEAESSRGIPRRH